MKTLYIDCSMGAAGDMLMAALLELIDDREEFLEAMNRLLPGVVEVSAEADEKCGVTGTHIRVKVHGEEEGEWGHEHDHEHHHHDHDHGHSHDHEHHHHHSGLADIDAVIDNMAVSDKVKKDAKAVYRLIGEAESKVHGKTADQIHFHEVGTLDAVADVVGNCILMEKIGAERIAASPVHVGSGSVKCAHGILPVPAPATALLLTGIPVYNGAVRGELCTPTGAALLKYFADSFGEMPAMTMEKIGYGTGSKDFEPYPNCLRVILGDDGEKGDSVSELAANIDDMTAEELGYAMELLMKEGALDVYCEHITMKKSRPAVKLVCMCRPEETEKFTRLMIKHTSTIGVREYRCRRFTMERHTEERKTPWGPVEVKVCSGYGTVKAKAEFDQVAEIAEEKGLSLREVKKEISGGL